MRASVPVALVAALATLAAGHRPLTSKPSCDGDFSSAATALAVPDASISWSFSHYLDCTNRAVWMSFVNPEADFEFYVGVGIPVMSRFSDLRADALIIGPGLPALSEADLALVPEDVKSSPVWSEPNIGAILHRSPQDQSTCDHLGTVMQGHSTVRNGRCDFYEPFGQTNSWRVLDADLNVMPVAGETYYVAVWLQEHQSGKIGIALGTWVENFITPFQIAVPTCERSLLDFSEKLGAQDLCLPVRSCPRTRPIPRTVCTATGSCSEASTCEDTIATNPMCTFGSMCNCVEIIQAHPCGTSMATAMGSVAINSVCASTCNACGDSPHNASMVCGGQACPRAVRLWDETNMAMHRGMAINFTCNVDIDFVHGMIPHHQGAVDMCDVLIEQLSCEADGGLDGLVHFCQHVRLEQEREMAGMMAWLDARNLTENATCSMPPMNQMSAMNQMPDMDHSQHSHHSMDASMMMGCGNTACASTNAFMEANHLMHRGMFADVSCDHKVDFVRMMIPHHAGAIVMCEILTNSSAQDNYLEELCANITRVQRAEVAWLSEWLHARGHDVLAPCGSCEHGQHEAPPPPRPCEDTLPASSFCHVLGGDYYCTCEAAVVQSGCSSTLEVSGFGALNVSAECPRSCGLCPAERPPALHQRCVAQGHNHHTDQDQAMALDRASIKVPHTMATVSAVLLALAIASLG